MTDRSSSIHKWHASRVVFGADGIERVGDELQVLGLQRALVLSTPPQAALVRRVADALGARAAGVFDQAVMHVPIETARHARASPCWQCCGARALGSPPPS